jgi:hypothetical protein
VVDMEVQAASGSTTADLVVSRLSISRRMLLCGERGCLWQTFIFCGWMTKVCYRPY